MIDETALLPVRTLLDFTDHLWNLPACPDNIPEFTGIRKGDFSWQYYPKF